MEERERQFIPGLGILLLATLLLGAAGALLHDFNDVPFGLAGFAIWGGAVLVTFVLGTAYLSRRLLPVQGNQGWSEGFRLLWRNYTLGAANLLYGRRREPVASAGGKRKKPRTTELSPSFHIIRAGFLYSHQAAAIARGNTFSRADGPGLVFLHSGESILQLFDLRPQSRKLSVSALTKDGIPVETTVSVSFRVRRPAPDRRRPRSVEAEDFPYPYDRDALFDLAYTGTVADDEKRDWRDLVCPQAATLLVTEIGKFTLDQLLEGAGSEPISAMKDRIKNSLKDMQEDEEVQTLPTGIEILGVGIGSLKLPEEVTAKRLSTWQVQWQNRVAAENITGDIEAYRQYQEALAQAQAENVEKLLLSIDRMRRESGYELHDVITLRLVEIAEAISASRMLEPMASRTSIKSLADEVSVELRKSLQQGEKK